MAEERTPSPTARVLRKARTGESWSHAALQAAYRAGGNAGETTGDFSPTSPAAAPNPDPAWFTAPAATQHRAPGDQAPMGPAPGGWC